MPKKEDAKGSEDDDDKSVKGQDQEPADRDDDDDDVEDKGGKAAAGIEDSAAREDAKERRAERRRLRESRFELSQREASEAKAAVERMSRELADERAQRRKEADEVKAKTETAGAATQIEKELDDVEKEMNAQLQIMQDPKVDQNATMARYRQLERKRLGLITKMHMPAPGQQSQQQEQPNYAAQMLAAEFPEVMDGGKNQDAARAEYQYLVHRKGRPPGLATEKEACANVAVDLGTRKAAEPTDQQRQRYQGTPSGRGGGNGARKDFTPEELDVMAGAGVSAAAVRKEMERQKQKQ